MNVLIGFVVVGLLVIINIIIGSVVWIKNFVHKQYRNSIKNKNTYSKKTN